MGMKVGGYSMKIGAIILLFIIVNTAFYGQRVYKELKPELWKLSFSITPGEKLDSWISERVNNKSHHNEIYLIPVIIVNNSVYLNTGDSFKKYKIIIDDNMGVSFQSRLDRLRGDRFWIVGHWGYDVTPLIVDDSIVFSPHNLIEALHGFDRGIIYQYLN